jgi:hypothetical protein
MSQYQQHPQFDSQGFPVKPKKHTARNIIIGVVVAMIAVIGGCTALIGGALNSVDTGGDQVTGTTPTVAPTSEATTEPPATTTAPTTEATVPEPPSDTSTIGGAWLTYESGLAVRVTKAKVFTLDSYDAAKARGNKGVAVTVSIKNGSTDVFDAALASIKLQYGPDGVEADSTVGDNYDTFGFEGTIARGKTKTVTMGFSVPPKFTKDLLVQVTPDWDSETTNFTGAAK